MQKNDVITQRAGQPFVADEILYYTIQEVSDKLGIPIQKLRRWDQEGVEYVRSNIDWCARCSRRMVGLNPGLTAEQALDLAHELSQDETLRCKGPELVAEDLHRVALRTDD